MIKAATLNIRHHADRWVERFPLVVETLLAADADLIGLQEVSLKLGTKNQAQMIADALHEKLGKECYQVYFRACRGTQHKNEGIAILSRLPVLAVASIPLPGIWRVALRVEVDWEGRRFGFVNTHLHHEPHDDEVIRYPQAEKLLAWAQAQDHPCLVVADFNAVPESTTIRLLKRHYRSAYEAVHGVEPEYTCPTPLDPGFSMKKKTMIDYVFYPADAFSVQACGLIGDIPHPQDATLYPSDHLGILAAFA